MDNLHGGSSSSHHAYRLFLYITSLGGTASPTLEKEPFQRSLLAAQLANSKNAGKKEAPAVNLGWNSHEAVVSVCELLLLCTGAGEVEQESEFSGIK